MNITGKQYSFSLPLFTHHTHVIRCWNKYWILHTTALLRCLGHKILTAYFNCFFSLPCISQRIPSTFYPNQCVFVWQWPRSVSSRTARGRREYFYSWFLISIWERRLQSPASKFLWIFVIRGYNSDLPNGRFFHAAIGHNTRRKIVFKSEYAVKFNGDDGNK